MNRASDSGSECRGFESRRSHIKLSVMKKIILSILCLAVSLTAVAQSNVFTLVYATSDDGFVNVRASASTRARVVDKVYQMMHGVSTSMLISDGDTWAKVQGEKGKVGYSVKRYLGYITWYTGEGKARLVANKAKTTIYRESNKDGSYEPFLKVNAGTIIADDFTGPDNGYYCLHTAHDNLFIKASDLLIDYR